MNGAELTTQIEFIALIIDKYGILGVIVLAIIVAYKKREELIAIFKQIKPNPAPEKEKGVTGNLIDHKLFIVDELLLQKDDLGVALITFWQSVKYELRTEIIKGVEKDLCVLLINVVINHKDKLKSVKSNPEITKAIVKSINILIIDFANDFHSRNCEFTDSNTANHLLLNQLLLVERAIYSDYKTYYKLLYGTIDSNS